MQLDIAQALKSEPYTNEQMEEFFDFDVECHCCGAKSRYKEHKLTTVCSIFGGFSVSLCADCLFERKEPYWAMVNAICFAGGNNFPDGINEAFVTEVRRQLKLHNITEEKFIEDVRQCDLDMQEAMSFCIMDDKFDDFEEDIF